MENTDKFFRDGEWDEHLYEQYLAQETEDTWELQNAPWRPAMRDWMKHGCEVPLIVWQYSGVVCPIQTHCNGAYFLFINRHSPCDECPFESKNARAYIELSKAIKSCIDSNELTAKG